MRHWSAKMVIWMSGLYHGSNVPLTAEYYHVENSFGHVFSHILAVLSSTLDSNSLVFVSNAPSWWCRSDEAAHSTQSPFGPTKCRAWASIRLCRRCWCVSGVTIWFFFAWNYHSSSTLQPQWQSQILFRTDLHPIVLPFRCFQTFLVVHLQCQNRHF